MVLTLPHILCKLGTTLAGAEDTGAVDEAISTLDKVRLAAFTNDLASLDCKPSVLGSDSLIPGDLFLYNDSCENGIKKGPPHVHMVSGLRVVGGAMLYTAGFHGPVRFPVSVLYSERAAGIVLHAGSVPFASLEADFYDGAFREAAPLWETKMLADEAGEFLAWRREAAVGTRCAGLAGTPAHLFDGQDYHIVRYGVTPFMSLRAPANEAEAELVASRLCSDMQAIPHGELDHMQTFKQKAEMLVFIGESASEIKPSKELQAVEYEERLRIARRMMEQRPVLSWLSTIILHNAADCAVDEQGEHKNEYCTGLKYSSSNEAAIRSVCDDELRSVKASSAVKCSDLEADEIHNRGAYTLGSVVRGAGRLHTTKLLMTGTLEANARAVLEAVAVETFDASEAQLAIASGLQNCTDHMTPNTAISALGKCLAEDQALAILTREQDGRISNAKLVSKDTVVTNVRGDAMSRLLLFPWVTCVIIDKEAVSLLLVKEPEGVDAEAFARNKLRLGDCVKPRAGPDDACLAKAVVDLKSEVAELKNANSCALGAIKDFERKLNLLLEKRFESEPPPAAQPAAQPAAEPTAEPCSVSETVQSLKRTLDILSKFENKQRKT